MGLGKLRGECKAGKCTLPVVCGNGVVQGDEHCECASGTNCRFCSKCKLAQGKQCSPGGTHKSCCDAKGMFTTSTAACTTSHGSKGYCNGGKCSAARCYVNLSTSSGVKLLDTFCGTSDKNPCRAKCGSSKTKECYDSGSWTSGGIKLADGAFCTKNGKRGQCKSGFCGALLATTKRPTRAPTKAPTKAAVKTTEKKEVKTTEKKETITVCTGKGKKRKCVEIVKGATTKAPTKAPVKTTEKKEVKTTEKKETITVCTGKGKKTKMCGNRKGSHDAKADAKTDAKTDAKKADNQKKLKQGRKEKATKGCQCKKEKEAAAKKKAAAAKKKAAAEAKKKKKAAAAAKKKEAAAKKKQQKAAAAAKKKEAAAKKKAAAAAKKKA